ncbi:MAG: diacylglycerol kinase family protein [Candidatus Paceibacterota bacterium]
MKKLSEKKRFSLVARGKSIANAFRGISIVVRSTHNLWVHIFFAIVVICFGFLFNISSLEWIAVIFSIGLVFITETINTSIEIDIDLTSPNYHPYARDTKDIAAGAVLISCVVAVIVGLIIFLPKVLVLSF